MKARELIGILRRLGAVERPGKGSHIRFSLGACNTTVPNHKGEDIKAGTLNAIEASLEPRPRQGLAQEGHPRGAVGAAP